MLALRDLVAQINVAFLVLNAISVVTADYRLSLQDFGSLQQEHVSRLARLDHDNLLGRYLRSVEKCCVHFFKGGGSVMLGRVLLGYVLASWHGQLPLEVADSELSRNRRRIELKFVRLNNQKPLNCRGAVLRGLGE